MKIDFEIIGGVIPNGLDIFRHDFFSIGLRVFEISVFLLLSLNFDHFFEAFVVFAGRFEEFAFAFDEVIENF